MSLLKAKKRLLMLSPVGLEPMKYKRWALAQLSLVSFLFGSFLLHPLKLNPNTEYKQISVLNTIFGRDKSENLVIKLLTNNTLSEIEILY